MTRARGNNRILPEKPSEASDFSSDLSKFFMEIFPTENGERRKTWFFRLSLAVGIKTSRLKDLFYDRRCSMRAVELATIQRSEGVLLENQLNDLKRRQAALSARLEAFKGKDHRENHPSRRVLRASGNRLGSVSGRVSR